MASNAFFCFVLLSGFQDENVLMKPLTSFSPEPQLPAVVI